MNDEIGQIKTSIIQNPLIIANVLWNSAIFDLQSAM